MMAAARTTEATTMGQVLQTATEARQIRTQMAAADQDKTRGSAVRCKQRSRSIRTSCPNIEELFRN